MSVVFIIFLIFVAICILDVYATRLPGSQKVILVGTGNYPYNTYIDRPQIVVKLDNGYYINSKNYIRIIIVGNGLEYRGVNNDDEWLVESINKDTVIRNNDIVLVRFKDINKVKLIEFKDLYYLTYNNIEAIGILKYCINTKNKD